MRAFHEDPARAKGKTPPCGNFPETTSVPWGVLEAHSILAMPPCCLHDYCRGYSSRQAQSAEADRELHIYIILSLKLQQSVLVYSCGRQPSEG